MKQLLYLIGQPGAGKTILLAKALEGCKNEAHTKPFGMRFYPYAELGEACVELGLSRPPFSGTDTLSMGVQPLALNWLAETSVRYVIGEGDRLSTEGFFLGARERGWKVTVAWLSTPDTLAAERRRARGTVQNACWVKGRVSKVEKLVHKFATPEWCLDGCSSVDELAMRLRNHPVVARIREVSL
jgi:hypothetical protein